MSMLNITAPYRRDEHGTLKVPVVMPLVEVTVDGAGALDIRLDREPYSAEGGVNRNDLQRILLTIADDLGAPLRVEVHESDGTAFTDIVMPHRETTPAAPAPDPAGRSAAGFLPDEEVSIAVIVGRHQSGSAGWTEPRIPPALLAAHKGDVVLLGRTSGAIKVCGA